MKKLKLEELGRIDVEEFKAKAKPNLCVILNDIRSALNVGSFFRSSDCFMVEKLYLCGITAKPPHKEIFKSAIGSENSVDWEYHENILDLVVQLKSKGYRCIGIEQTDQSISLKSFTCSKDDKLALIFGNEVEGLSIDVLPFLDQAIELEQFGTKHSLNVAVCGGIVLWELARQLRT